MLFLFFLVELTPLGERLIFLGKIIGKDAQFLWQGSDLHGNREFALVCRNLVGGFLNELCLTQ